MSDASFLGFDEAAGRERGGAAMTLYAAIATLKKRLSSAQAARDCWHAAGNEQKCLEAGYIVEALRRQLERLELAARAAASKGA
jgi:hypothetical protein